MGTFCLRIFRNSNRFKQGTKENQADTHICMFVKVYKCRERRRVTPSSAGVAVSAASFNLDSKVPIVRRQFKQFSFHTNIQVVEKYNLCQYY